MKAAPNRYQKEIDKILKALLAYNPQKVILFGSAARGKTGEESDLDFFVVKDTSLKFHERALAVKKFLGDLPYKIPLDVVVWTPKEFEKGIKENRFFLEQVLNEGKVLYEEK